jgi:hypothetical protein
MKKLELFLPRLLPWCPSAPEPLIYQELLDSAIQFCEESHVVRYITDPITVIPGVATYDIELPQYTDLVRVMRVYYADGPFSYPVGGFNNWVISDIGEITLFPTPTSDPKRPMFFEVVTKPTRSANQVADQLFTDWVEGVCGGAIQRICAMPDQPWSNDANAAKGANAYRIWKNKAMFEATKGRVQRDTVVTPRPFVGRGAWR